MNQKLGTKMSIYCHIWCIIEYLFTRHISCDLLMKPQFSVGRTSCDDALTRHISCDVLWNFNLSLEELALV